VRRAVESADDAPPATGSPERSGAAVSCCSRAGVLLGFCCWKGPQRSRATARASRRLGLVLLAGADSCPWRLHTATRGHSSSTNAPADASGFMRTSCMHEIHAQHAPQRRRVGPWPASCAWACQGARGQAVIARTDIGSVEKGLHSERHPLATAPPPCRRLHHAVQRRPGPWNRSQHRVPVHEPRWSHAGAMLASPVAASAQAAG
jgi:hypothetical protein